MVLNRYTAWKVSKYGVFSGQYFPAFGPEKTPYLDTLHAMIKKTLFFIFPWIASGCKYLLKPRPLRSRLRQTKVYCGRRCIKTRKIFVFKSIIFNKKKLLPNKHFFLEIRDVEEDILAKEVNQTVNLIDPPKKPKNCSEKLFFGTFLEISTSPIPNERLFLLQHYQF